MAATNLVVMLSFVNLVTEDGVALEALVRESRRMAVTAAPPVMMMGVMRWLWLISGSFLGWWHSRGSKARG